MTQTMKYHETMRAELSPDCYGGETCDKIVPRWHGYCDGDKESEDFREPIKLDPRQFPPGTTVIVSEPLCPTCGEHRQRKFPTPKRGDLFEAKCDCGFDWIDWTLSKYS